MMNNDLVGKIVFGSTTFNNASKCLETKNRPGLVIAQSGDGHSLTCVIFSTIKSHKFDPYDLFIDLNVYSKLKLSESSYIRCGRLMTVNLDILKRDRHNQIICFDFKKNYPSTFKKVVELTSEYLKFNQNNLIENTNQDFKEEVKALEKENEYLKSVLMEMHQTISMLSSTRNQTIVSNEAIIEAIDDELYATLSSVLTDFEFDKFENEFKLSDYMIDLIMQKQSKRSAQNKGKENFK